MKQPIAPDHIKAAGRKLWNDQTSRYVFSDSELVTLTQACELVDYVEFCRTTVAKDGPMLTNRFGTHYEHPLAIASRSSQQLLRAILRDLRPTKAPKQSTTTRRNHALRAI